MTASPLILTVFVASTVAAVEALTIVIGDDWRVATVVVATLAPVCLTAAPGWSLRRATAGMRIDVRGLV